VTLLSAHFDSSEFEQGGASIPDALMGNATDLANVLEIVRQAGGNLPLRITSGYRTPTDNAAVGGVNGSDHTQARAADVAPSSGDVVNYAAAVLANMGHGVFGQFIVYPNDGHIHVSLPGAHVGQILVSVRPGSYSAWDGNADDVPGITSGSVDAATADAPTDETDSAISPVEAILGLLILSWLYVRYF
jgi:Peptidase M15